MKKILRVVKIIGLVIAAILGVGLVTMMVAGLYLDLPVLLRQGWVAQRVAPASVMEAVLFFLLLSCAGATVGLRESWVKTA